MPYRRRGRRRRRRRRGAMSLSRRVKSILNSTAEVKKTSATYDSVVVTNAFWSEVIPRLAQGVNSLERVGDSVRLRGVHMSVTFWVTTATSVRRLRVLVYKPRGEYVATTSPYGANVTNPIDQKSFVPKKDRLFVLAPLNAGYGGAVQQVTFTYNKKWTGQTGPRVYYNTAASPVPTSGMLAFSWQQDTTQEIRVSGRVDMYYQDL